MGILISAAILAAAMWIVARHDADMEFPKVIGVAAAVAVSSWVGYALIGIFALPVILFLLGFALYRFCYLSIPQAAIVSGIWLAAQIGIGLLLP